MTDHLSVVVLSFKKVSCVLWDILNKSFLYLHCWSRMCRRWPWWRQRASCSSYSLHLSQSSQFHGHPRSHQDSGSSGDRQSLPKRQRNRKMLLRLGHIFWFKQRQILQNWWNKPNLTHVAARHNTISTSTDHVCGDQIAPPVRPGTGAVINNRKKSLLHDVSNRASSFRGERQRIQIQG